MGRCAAHTKFNRLWAHKSWAKIRFITLQIRLASDFQSAVMDGYGYKFNELPAKEKLTAGNYEAWSLSMGPCLFSTDCRLLIFGVQGGPPVPRPVNFYTQGSQAWLDTKRDVENWDKFDEVLTTFSLFSRIRALLHYSYGQPSSYLTVITLKVTED